MAKKSSYIAENSPFLNGLTELSEYLHMDKRVVRKKILNLGFEPRVDLGGVALYHKADLDKFFIELKQKVIKD